MIAKDSMKHKAKGTLNYNSGFACDMLWFLDCHMQLVSAGIPPTVHFSHGTYKRQFVYCFEKATQHKCEIFFYVGRNCSPVYVSGILKGL